MIDHFSVLFLEVLSASLYRVYSTLTFNVMWGDRSKIFYNKTLDSAVCFTYSAVVHHRSPRVVLNKGCLIALQCNIIKITVGHKIC